MATEKQVVANQTNALKSTGPRTAEGKMISSANATKHGVLTSALLIPGENEEMFQDFSDKIRSSLDPQNGIEEFHADRIIACAWRLRRVIQIENIFLREGKENIGFGITFDHLNKKDKSLRTIEENVALYFREDQVSITILNRYEVSIERSMNRSIHELQRLKALKAGELGAVPIALDVDLGNYK